ncbi:MAG: hypothetical protein JJE44_07815 [Flavobacteriaceae bacterium]|nr:hypothetical protein [Flavobacteriaceae bacterium]
MAKGIKTGGRTKGALNKSTTEIRERFNLLLDNNFNKLQSDIDLLEPKDRIKTILELAKFVVPTLRSTELTTDNENNNFLPIVINLGTGIEPDKND